jgi:hypothetical protein
MVIVGRPINGISINLLEYLLDDNGEVRKFTNKESAKKFLRGNGFTSADINSFTFETTNGQTDGTGLM